ncbi:hypothetical protein I316_00776 [Kwoniella heveanensis BCC8398]|uniref:Zn(2)-C6 fungal-type domain-containing protein n=1 Tax=Kwoniella heveanensis BCC8398 TaxID=1296120 RepID=A0A1B9H309_9TREE|nr:hypothetical protein I316_00776 [Kwoniella heveanensis BCC8398]
MSPTPPYDDILDDETLAPLKRNHACLQCKKRKVKCDAIKPTCSPCLRSHAHAVRSAHRNGTAPPTLTCSYAEEGPLDASPPDESVPKKKKSVSSDKHSGSGPGSTGTAVGAGSKRQHTTQGTRESVDAEKEALKARIAELEARLSAMTPPSSIKDNEAPFDIDSSRRSSNAQTTSNAFIFGETRIPSTSFDSIGANGNKNSDSPTWDIPVIGTGVDMSNAAPLPDGLGGAADFAGLDDLFMVPIGWPKHLPLPFMLEHLVETFFNYVPQTPRMLHRGSLLARIKLPPTSPDFPFPGLLHAICASAANYTAWVNNLAPHLLEEAVQRHLNMGVDLVHIEDFGLAQAQAAHQAIDVFTSACIMGGGHHMLQVAQACLLVGDVYFAKGFPMKGWMMAAQPSRILSVLELGNRTSRRSFKEPMLAHPKNDQEREQRLITLWMAFVIDSGFAVNSGWAPSMQLKDTRCNLPTSASQWFRSDGNMEANTQYPESPDIFYSHPVEDSFVFVIKGSMLMSMAAQWLRDWQQRQRVPGDELQGLHTESFKTIMHRIEAFTSTIPTALKNIYRMVDNTSSTQPSGFDANLLSIHIIPNIAICLIHEPFLQWSPYDPATVVTQKAYDSVMSVLHLIPSNLDVTLILTPFLAFSLYTLGRFVVDFIHHAAQTGQYQMATKYTADLKTVQNLLERYGQRHALGNAMTHFLTNYLKANGRPLTGEEVCHFHDRRITYSAPAASPDVNLGPEAEAKYYAKLQKHFATDFGSGNTNGPILEELSPNSVQGSSTSASVTGSGSGSNTTPSITTPGKSNEPTPENTGMIWPSIGAGVTDQVKSSAQPSWSTWQDPSITPPILIQTHQQQVSESNLPSRAPSGTFHGLGTIPGDALDCFAQSASTMTIAPNGQVPLPDPLDSLTIESNGLPNVGGFEGLGWKFNVGTGVGN